jgi:hypothetical protein
MLLVVNFYNAGVVTCDRRIGSWYETTNRGVKMHSWVFNIPWWENTFLG